MIGTAEVEQVTAERAMLVRFCARYTGDPDAAEDLAQQTLLDAWRREEQLRDPAARRGWLLSIARTTCLMWARRKSREAGRSRPFDPAEEEWSGSSPDPVETLERGDLLVLLDRALSLLPTDTRDALVRRYVEDRPQAEVATILGVSEGAVDARLQRGKAALRKVFATDLYDDALSLGLVSVDGAGWQETRLWCPGCAGRRLEGRFEPDLGELDLRCPACSYPDTFYIHAHMDERLRDLKTFKPATSRVLDTIHEMYRVRPVDGVVSCVCGDRVPIERGALPGLPESAFYPDAGNTYIWCRRCESIDHETWHSLTWSLPEARAFWRDNARMRFLPVREIEIGGQPAVVTGFESVTGRSRLEVVTLRDSLHVVSVDGRARSDAGHAL